MNAGAEQVWQLISQPFHFGVSENFFFRNGVSYPHTMKLISHDGKRYLKCVYNNGEVVAPILSYEENKSFTFSLGDSIASMREKNIFKQTQTMHIKNHFSIDSGRFELVAIDDAHCKLIASTAYKHKFQPAFYTNLWVKYFIHRLHAHVLESVKNSL